MSEFQSLKRNNYFAGKQLTAEDFQAEQHYFLETLRRHNRSLHGFGAVAGLKVHRKGSRIEIEPGVALDCLGNEIVVGELVSVNLAADLPASSNLYVCLKYAEKDCHRGTLQNGQEAPMIEQTFEVVLLKENPQRNHRRENSRWQSCGKLHEFALARLRRMSGGWSIDRRYRAPRVK